MSFQLLAKRKDRDGGDCIVFRLPVGKNQLVGRAGSGGENDRLLDRQQTINATTRCRNRLDTLSHRIRRGTARYGAVPHGAVSGMKEPTAERVCVPPDVTTFYVADSDDGGAALMLTY